MRDHFLHVCKFNDGVIEGGATVTVGESAGQYGTIRVGRGGLLEGFILLVVDFKLKKL